MCDQVLLDVSQTSACCLVPFFKSVSAILQSTCYCCRTQRLLNITCEVDILESGACFSYKITYKCIRVNRYTDTNKTFRAKGVKGNFHPEVRQCGDDNNDPVHYIEHSVLCNTMHRENDCLNDIEIQTSIFFENGLSSVKTWRATDSLTLMYPPSAYVITRVSWNFAKTRPHKWCIVRLNINISKGSPCCPSVLPFTKWTCPFQSKYRNLVLQVRMVLK